MATIRELYVNYEGNWEEARTVFVYAVYFIYSISYLFNIPIGKQSLINYSTMVSFSFSAIDFNIVSKTSDNSLGYPTVEIM